MEVEKFPARMNVAKDSSTTMKADIQKEVLRLFGGNEVTWERAKSYFTSMPDPPFGNMEGFAWQAEALQVKPTSPFKDTGNTNPIGFKVDKNIHIPEVRFLGTSQLGLHFEDFEYELHRYDGTPTADAQALEPIVFITNSGSLGTSVPSRFFMRSKDLEDRVCGKYTERVKLFALDWLVGATLQTSINKYFPLNLNMDKATSTDKDRAAAAKIVKIMGMRDSHLPIWDQDGDLLDWERSARVLAGLLVRSLDDEDKAVELMPALYFRNFCRLLVAAATTPRNNFTVMARFWSHEIPGQKDIEFRYTLPRGGEGLTEEDKKFWAAIIKTAHEDVVDNLKKKIRDYPHKKPTTFIPSITCNVDTETDAENEDSYTWVTSHPQGLYDLSIPDEQYLSMKGEVTFRPGCQNYPFINGALRSPTIDLWKLQIRNPEPPKPTTTYTIITEKKLSRAATWPRKCDQNTVMNNKTAYEVAKGLFGDNNLPERGRAEWLHRSAYSFGGLNEESGPPTERGPDSSQDQSNLVIGTYAANTRMIKFEEYLKRLVNLAGLKATLKTMLSYEDLDYFGEYYAWPYTTDSGRNSSWITPVLKYHWKIYGADDKQLASGIAKFWLFSRNAPMRFEAMLDNALDQKLYKVYNSKKDDPDKPKVRALLEAVWKDTAYSLFV